MDKIELKLDEALNEVQSNVGTSTDVLLNTDYSLEVAKEKTIEILTSFARLLQQGQTEITPFVIGMTNGVPIVQQLTVNEDGSLSLPEMKVNAPEDLKRKSKLVRRILKGITPVLQAEIENITYVALMRKDEQKLNETLISLKESKVTPRLENRAGCIWVIVGQYEFVI